MYFHCRKLTGLRKDDIYCNLRIPDQRNTLKDDINIVILTGRFSQFFFYFLHSSSFPKPGAYITHNAPWPLSGITGGSLWDTHTRLHATSSIYADLHPETFIKLWCVKLVELPFNLMIYCGVLSFLLRPGDLLHGRETLERRSVRSQPKLARAGERRGPKLYQHLHRADWRSPQSYHGKKE